MQRSNFSCDRHVLVHAEIVAPVWAAAYVLGYLSLNQLCVEYGRGPLWGGWSQTGPQQHFIFVGKTMECRDGTALS